MLAKAMRAALFATAWWLGAASPIAAQTAAAPAGTTTSSQAVGQLDALEASTLAIIADGRPEVANRVFTGNPLISSRTAELSALNGQIDSARSIYGRVISWERIGTLSLGTTLSRRRYLVQHQNMMVMWEVTYIYLPRGWTVANVVFSDQISRITDEF